MLRLSCGTSLIGTISMAIRLPLIAMNWSGAFVKGKRGTPVGLWGWKNNLVQTTKISLHFPLL